MNSVIFFGGKVMDCQKLFDIIDSLNEEYIKIWEDVCNIESPTNHKEGVDKVGEYFLKKLERFGFETEILECEKAGNAICVTMNPDVNSPAVVFSGHIDTVHPLGLFGYPPVKFEGDKILGPGVVDCKGGVVASLMAIDALYKCGYNKRPIKLIIQTDEETSSKQSNKKTVEFMCEKSAGAIAFLNTEGISGNTATIQRKGIIRYKYTVKGKACHSALCSGGANAIAEAAHKILKLEKYKDTDSITCNCGVISGGSAPNTVADECSFTDDIRFSNKEQLEHIKKVAKEIADINEIEGCSCILEEVSFRPAMPITDCNKELLDKMNNIYRENGLPELTGRFALSGSDAAYICEIGVPCIDSIGTEGGKIHSAEEYAFINSLKEAAKRLASVAYCI